MLIKIVSLLKNYLMKKIVSKFIFWLMGWEAIGTFDFPKKCIIIAAPHTSNWDFLVGRCYGYISGIKPRYLIKSSYFAPIIGAFFRRNGGIPVSREYNTNLVSQIIDKFNNTNEFRLGIAPEGTRSRVLKWKTGFYHMAHKSNVPIILVALDFKKKKIGVISSLLTTGDIDSDMLFIQEKFMNVQGKIPENFNPKII